MPVLCVLAEEKKILVFCPFLPLTTQVSEKCGRANKGFCRCRSVSANCEDSAMVTRMKNTEGQQKLVPYRFGFDW
jgi:hypothetical protein